MSIFIYYFITDILLFLFAKVNKNNTKSLSTVRFVLFLYHIILEGENIKFIAP